MEGELSYQIIGFFFSGNADLSANDKTVYVQQTNNRQDNNVKLGARYKSSEPNHLYEIELDADDCRVLGQMLIDIAKHLE